MKAILATLGVFVAIGCSGAAAQPTATPEPTSVPTASVWVKPSGSPVVYPPTPTRTPVRTATPFPTYTPTPTPEPPFPKDEYYELAQALREAHEDFKPSRGWRSAYEHTGFYLGVAVFMRACEGEGLNNHFAPLRDPFKLFRSGNISRRDGGAYPAIVVEDGRSHPERVGGEAPVGRWELYSDREFGFGLYCMHVDASKHFEVALAPLPPDPYSLDGNTCVNVPTVELGEGRRLLLIDEESQSLDQTVVRVLPRCSYGLRFEFTSSVLARKCQEVVEHYRSDPKCRTPGVYGLALARVHRDNPIPRPERPSCEQEMRRVFPHLKYASRWEPALDKLIKTCQERRRREG